MNEKSGTRSCYAGDKLPESTGDKLPVGEMDSIFLGKLLRYALGYGSIGRSVYRRGTILDQDCRGCLFKECLYTPLGNVEIFGG